MITFIEWKNQEENPQLDETSVYEKWKFDKSLEQNSNISFMTFESKDDFFTVEIGEFPLTIREKIICEVNLFEALNKYVVRWPVSKPVGKTNYKRIIVVANSPEEAQEMVKQNMKGSSGQFRGFGSSKYSGETEVSPVSDINSVIELLKGAKGKSLLNVISPSDLNIVLKTVMSRDVGQVSSENKELLRLSMNRVLRDPELVWMYDPVAWGEQQLKSIPNWERMAKWSYIKDKLGNKTNFKVVDDNYLLFQRAAKQGILKMKPTSAAQKPSSAQTPVSNVLSADVAKQAGLPDEFVDQPLNTKIGPGMTLADLVSAKTGGSMPMGSPPQESNPKVQGLGRMSDVEKQFGREFTDRLRQKYRQG